MKKYVKGTLDKLAKQYPDLIVAQGVDHSLSVTDKYDKFTITTHKYIPDYVSTIIKRRVKQYLQKSFNGHGQYLDYTLNPNFTITYNNSRLIINYTKYSVDFDKPKEIMAVEFETPGAADKYARLNGKFDCVKNYSGKPCIRDSTDIDYVSHMLTARFRKLSPWPYLPKTYPNKAKKHLEQVISLMTEYCIKDARQGIYYTTFKPYSAHVDLTDTKYILDFEKIVLYSFPIKSEEVSHPIYLFK